MTNAGRAEQGVMLPEEDLVRRDLLLRYDSAFGEMDRTFLPILTMLDGRAWTVTKSRGLRPPTAYLMLALLTKACKTFRAIRLVSGAGLGQDAGVLLRSLFETSAAIHWVLQCDSVRRTRLMFAHGAIRKSVQVNEMSAVRGIKRTGRALQRHSKTHVAEATKHLSAAESESIRKHWSGLSGGLKAVTERLGRGDGWLRAYTIVYRDTSSTAHVSDLLEHISLDETSTFTIKIAPGDVGLPRVPNVARMLLLSAAQRIDERMGLGFTAALERVSPPRLRRRKPAATTR